MVDPEQPTKKLSDPGQDETLTLAANEISPTEAIHPPWYPGKVIEGLYRIEGEIARGGMGVVHKATDLATNNFVVIKSLLPDVAQDAQYKKRFIREAEEWVKLGPHPNLVRAFTAHEIEYLPRIVAEYVDGPTLSDLLDEQPPSFERALEIATQICWGMAYAHEKGIAHRDLKPGNIMIDSEGTAKVMDFGLVKVIADDQSDTRIMDTKGNNTSYEASLMTMGIIGTPEYMAPEQWDGQGSKASDIYAVGVILYELFCGRLPFDHPDLEGMGRITAYYYSHTKENPPEPDQIIIAQDQSLPDPLMQLMLQCLEKDLDKRPKDFRAMAKRLNQIAQKTNGREAAPEPSSQELDRKGRLDQANAYMRLGIGCSFRGDYGKAMDLYDKARCLKMTPMLI